MSRAQKVVVGTPYKIRAHRVCAVIPQVKKRPGGARRAKLYLPISGGLTLRKFGGAMLLITLGSRREPKYVRRGQKVLSGRKPAFYGG